MNHPHKNPLKIIRSFVLRQGRLSRRQKTALDSAWQYYGLNAEQTDYNWSTVFGNHHPIILEIGFGMGQSLLQMAQASPNVNFIGVEVHKPGVGAFLADLTEHQLRNVRIFCADAVAILAHCIKNHSLDGIYIFFPDPWPKRRHHKRRLIQSDFISQLAKKLKPKGYLHLATDWQDYAEHMLKVLSAEKNLMAIDPKDPHFSPLLNRPLTKYEARGLGLGHPVWEFIFRIIDVTF